MVCPISIAVRRPCVRAITIRNERQYPLSSNIDRGATPMRADAAWATPGFSGAPPSGPRSHPRRHDPAAPLGCARPSPFASAKQRAFGSVHCPAASAPLAPLRVRGAFGQKNPPRTAEKQRLRAPGLVLASMPVLVLVWVAGASPRKAEGFFGLPLRTHSCARGVEVAGVKNVADRRVFQGLQRRLNERRRVGPTKVRARRPTPEHRKNP